MDRSELYSRIEGLGEAGGDLLNSVKSMLHGADEEAKGYREKLKSFEPIVAEHASLKEMVEKSKSGASLEFQKLTTDFADLKGKFEQTEKEKSEIATKNKMLKIESVISDKIKTAYLESPQLVSDSVISKGLADINEKGEVVFKIGSDVFDVETGITKLESIYGLSKRAGVQQGITPPRGGEQRQEAKTMSRAAFDSMGHSERAAQIKSGVKITE